MTGILAKWARIAGGEVWPSAGKFRSLVQVLHSIQSTGGAEFRCVELLYPHGEKKAKNSSFP